MRNVVRLLTIAFFLGGWCTAVAQTPKGLPPPSYGTPSAASGGVLNAYEVRILRDWLLGFSMIVPAAELQTLLPPGYSVQSGSTALLNVSFVFQQRFEVTPSIFVAVPVFPYPSGTYGPSSVVIIQTLVKDPSGHLVAVILDSEQSTGDEANLQNAIFGVGGTRRASEMNMDVKEDAQKQMVRFKGHVMNNDLGLAIDVIANVPSAIATPLRNFLVPFPFRFLNGTTTPPTANVAVRVGSAADFITVPSAGSLTVAIPDNQLQLPEGTLTILGVGANMTLNRWREDFAKLTP